MTDNDRMSPSPDAGDVPALPDYASEPAAAADWDVATSTSPASDASSSTPAGGPGDNSPAGQNASTSGAVKEQGAQVVQDAVQTGQQVAGTAADEARAVAAQAADHVRDLAGEARSQLSDQAGAQQKNLAAWVKSLADELETMVHRGSGAEGSNESQNGVVIGYARQASERAHSAASWLEDHEPADLLSEASRFARQRPGVFLLLAAVGGVLAGRLTRGLTADGSADAMSSTRSTTPELTSASPNTSVTFGTPTPLVADTTRTGDSRDTMAPEAATEPTGGAWSAESR